MQTMKSTIVFLSSKDLWTDLNHDFGVHGGAYRLFSISSNKIKPIGRLLGKDKKGTLYIGKADSYVKRLVDLKKTISPDYKSNPHICGRRYKLNTDIALRFPFENLFVELFPDKLPEKREAHLLNGYFDTYGEVPPLNANGGNSKFK